MVNYLARLGWSHGDQEIFSRAELIQLFDIADVSAAGAIFDQTKLQWLSQHYMKTTDGARLAELVRPFLGRAGLPADVPPSTLIRIIDTLRERASTLVELVEIGRFYVEPPTEYEPKAAAKFFTGPGAERLGLLIDALRAAPDFTPSTLEAIYRELTVRLGVKLVDLAQLTRLAVVGRTASPPIFDVLSILGREEVLTRVDAARAAAGALA
jgi:glutamyl-tRNA synthetase